MTFLRNLVLALGALLIAVLVAWLFVPDIGSRYEDCTPSPRFGETCEWRTQGPARWFIHNAFIILIGVGIAYLLLKSTFSSKNNFHD